MSPRAWQSRGFLSCFSIAISFPALILFPLPFGFWNVRWVSNYFSGIVIGYLKKASMHFLTPFSSNGFIFDCIILFLRIVIASLPSRKVPFESFARHMTSRYRSHKPRKRGSSTKFISINIKQNAACCHLCPSCLDIMIWKSSNRGVLQHEKGVPARDSIPC